MLDVPCDRAEVTHAVRLALYDEPFRSKARQVVNPYGDGQASQRIADVLSRVSLDGLLRKEMAAQVLAS